MSSNEIFSADRLIVNSGETQTVSLGEEFNNLSAPTGENGGAISNDGTVTINENVTFDNNSAVYGGAINNNGGSVVINQSIFNNNTGLERGGAIYNDIDTANLEIKGSNL